MLYNFIIQAFIKAVATWPTNTKGYPNSFRIANSVADLESPPTYQEYLSGEFFSRSWILKGADPSHISLERPLIVMERDITSLESPYGRNQTTELWVSIVDDICDDCKETPDEVTKRLVNTLHECLIRVGKMKVWLHDNKGVKTYVVSYEQPDDAYIIYKDRFFIDDEIRIIPNPRLVQNAGFAASVKLKFSECMPTLIEFAPFNHPLPSGSTSCDTC